MVCIRVGMFVFEVLSIGDFDLSCGLIVGIIEKVSFR